MQFLQNDFAIDHFHRFKQSIPIPVAPVIRHQYRLTAINNFTIDRNTVHLMKINQIQPSVHSRQLAAFLHVTIYYRLTTPYSVLCTLYSVLGTLYSRLQKKMPLRFREMALTISMYVGLVLYNVSMLSTPYSRLVLFYQSCFHRVHYQAGH